MGHLVGGGSKGASAGRTGGIGMTSEDKRRFESQWPAVAARLERMLARRNIPIDRREDIVQETGLRLLRSWHRVDAARPLWPITVTIALNLMRDQARKGLDTEVPCELPERSDGYDVETLGLARLELKRAGIALSRMKPGQRDVLLAEVDPSAYSPTSSPAATKMLRMRARKKLSLLMQQVSALSIIPIAAVKRLGRFGHIVPFTRATEGAVTSALCGVLCVVALGGAVSLAPFSALPGNSSEDLTKMEVSEVGTTLPQQASTHPVLSADRERALLHRVTVNRKTAEDPLTTRNEARPRSVPTDRGTIEQGGSYEVPLGGKPLVEGEVLVQVFGGGHGSQVPTSLDCSEHMFSANEIDATCWSQNDPEKRYGVRVKHDGKTTLDELRDSGI